MAKSVTDAIIEAIKEKIHILDKARAVDIFLKVRDGKVVDRDIVDKDKPS